MNRNLNKLVIISAIIGVGASALHAQWTQVSGPANFHGGEICLASSGNSLYVGGGSVFFSTDNGSNWSATDSILSGAGIECILASGNNLFIGPANGILKSTDNGASWSRSDSGIPFPTEVYAFAVSGASMFAATGGAGIFLSTNNGTSWNAADTNLSEKYFFALAVSGSNIVAGSHSGIYISTDNGKDWTPSDSGITNRFINVLVTSGSATLAGAYPGVFMTTDGGRIWSEADSIPAPAHAIVAFAISDSNIFAGSYADGVFLSTDFGASWTAVNEGLGSNTYVSALAISGPNLFAVANGTVWRRPLSDMITAVKPVDNNNPETFFLRQNYPNPFNPSTVIDYQLPQRAFVTMRLYDVLGKQVAVFVDQVQNSGFHSLAFNATALPSGVYFYSLEAGSYHDTKKLLLLK